MRAVQPYIGGGVGVFAGATRETGEFVDFATRRSSARPSSAAARAAGPVILGGVRFPLGSWVIGGEIRYQSAEGELPPDQGFSGDKIDLGGFNYLVTFNVRF